LQSLDRLRLSAARDVKRQEGIETDIEKWRAAKSPEDLLELANKRLHEVS
jgi:hypothetical protein